MTTEQVRKKIAESAEAEWYNSIEETFRFPYIGFVNTIKGVSGVYEFLSKQLDGWEKFGSDIPSQLLASKNYFQSIKNQIDQFLVSYNNQSAANLASYWQNSIRPHIVNTNPHPLVYSAPEVEFLINVYRNRPASVQAAFNYIVDYNQFNANDKDSFIGMVLAYEFVNKNTSLLVERKNSEKNSINKIRNDFQSYLSESEVQLVQYLNNANKKYDEYAKLIDNLRNEKELAFNEFFKKTIDDFNHFDSDAKKRTKDLENSYEELLRLKKPAEYWNTRASQLRAEGWKSLRWLIILIIFVSAILYSLLWLTPEAMLNSFFGNDKSSALRWTIIFVTLVSFLAYGIRALTKVTFSSFHLARDAEERERLTYVYLAMVKDSSVDREDRHLIMQSLFSRADTGLLKDDSSPTMPGGGIADKFIK